MNGASREAQKKRQQQVQKEIPEWYCPACSAVLFGGEKACPICETERPDAGWPELSGDKDVWLGRVIRDRYLITQHIGEGSSGVVYRADSRIIPRSFAMKIMSVEQGVDLEKTTVRKRLDREVEALASLRNPHIVSFYDVFEPRPGFMAFVMDYIEGVTLEEMIRENGPLNVRRAAALARQLANGVFEAHQSGLIHRDLKPENIMIERLPAGDDFLRVLDFGIVWMRGEVHMTQGFIGTPLYASPEQARGEELDDRSDIYSLGAMLFFMLTGRPPFPGNEVMAVLHAHASKEPPKLSDVVPGPPFPDELEALVADLLSKERDARPSNLSEVIERLDLLKPATLAFESSFSEAVDESMPTSEATELGLPQPSSTEISPILKLDISDVSQVSEAEIVGQSIERVACSRGEYAFVTDGTLVFATHAGDERAEVDVEFPSAIASMAVCPDFALFGLADGTILRVDTDGKTEALFQDPRRAPITAVAVDPQGRTMLAGSKSGRLYVYRSYKRGEDWTRIGGGGKPVEALALNATGDQFGIAKGGEVQVFSVTTSHTPTFPVPVDEEVASLAFSNDDYLFAIHTVDGWVTLESAMTGQEFMKIESPGPGLAAVCFSGKDNLLGAFVENGRVTLNELT